MTSENTYPACDNCGNEADGEVYCGDCAAKWISERNDLRARVAELEDVLTSFFYDLAKAVPPGQLNEILLNTVSRNAEGGVSYCDDHIEAWARSFSRQLIEFRTKFTRAEVEASGYPDAIAVDDPPLPRSTRSDEPSRHACMNDPSKVNVRRRR